MKLFWIYPWMVYSVRLLLTRGRPNSRWSVIDKLSARSRLAEGKTIKKSNYTTSLCCVDRNHVKPDKLYLWKNILQNVGTTTIPIKSKIKCVQHVQHLATSREDRIACTQLQSRETHCFPNNAESI